jgi:hypothetical protein
VGPALTHRNLNKNQIALPDKPALELNVNENLNLELEYENQIAHPDPPEHELNVKEHINFNHMKHKTIESIENSSNRH